MKKNVKYSKKKFVVFIVFFMVLFLIVGCSQQANLNGKIVVAGEYNPEINPADFSSTITNRYLTLTPGKKMVYESETQDGLERIEVYVTNEKKMVMGVETVVVWDRVWLNNELIEDTMDWYAQDKEGNVWYFGEDTKTLVGGKVTSTKGSWEAGINGAKAGIVMKANPQIGESYRQEYYKGEAEDMADILSLDEVISIPFDKFNNCIKTFDYTPLEPDLKEHKYYCPEVGGFTLELDVNTGERVELVSIEYNSEPSPQTEEKPEMLSTKINEAQAIEIALKRVPGKFMDITIENKFGKLAYVVEIDADVETDVIIDIDTGEVLGVEI